MVGTLITGRDRSSSDRPSRKRPSERQTSGTRQTRRLVDLTQRRLEVLARHQSRHLDVAPEVAVLHGPHLDLGESVLVEEAAKDGRRVLAGQHRDVLSREMRNALRPRSAVTDGRCAVDGLKESRAEFGHGAALGETLHEGGHQPHAVLRLVQTLEALGSRGLKTGHEIELVAGEDLGTPEKLTSETLEPFGERNDHARLVGLVRAHRLFS